MKRSRMILLLAACVLLTGCTFRSRLNMNVRGQVQIVHYLPPQNVDTRVAWDIDLER